MAKEKEKFQLNKGTDHGFDISKGGKRKFDLTKDDDEPIVQSSVAPAPKPSTVAQPAPQATPKQPVSSSATSIADTRADIDDKPGNKKWLGIILAIIIIALIAWWLIPGNSETDESTPATTEVTTPATDNESEVDSTKAPILSDEQETTEAEQEAIEVPAEDITTPSAPVSESNVTAASTNNTTKPVTTSTGVISDDIEHEALKVIRGEYGIGLERKNKLGSKYQEIQNRVNELKRQGKF